MSTPTLTRVAAHFAARRLRKLEAQRAANRRGCKHRGRKKRRQAAVLRRREERKSALRGAKLWQAAHARRLAAPPPDAAPPPPVQTLFVLDEAAVAALKAPELEAVRLARMAKLQAGRAPVSVPAFQAATARLFEAENALLRADYDARKKLQARAHKAAKRQAHERRSPSPPPPPPPPPPPTRKPIALSIRKARAAAEARFNAELQTRPLTPPLAEHLRVGMSPRAAIKAALRVRLALPREERLRLEDLEAAERRAVWEARVVEIHARVSARRAAEVSPQARDARPRPELAPRAPGAEGAAPGAGAGAPGSSSPPSAPGD